MKTIFSTNETKEILLNLDLLLGKANQRKSQLHLRLIRAWYQMWFSNPENGILFQNWSTQWNSLLTAGPYSFPIPESIATHREKKIKSMPIILINGEPHQLTDVKITPIQKRFSHMGTVVQKSQLFTSFPDELKPQRMLVVVTIKDNADILIPSSEVRFKR
ncbi:MAG: hypothetical protein H7222_00890 [Methylotenera sp.]|nr:hypothetical protein [Oligoflexia bacterium]